LLQQKYTALNIAANLLDLALFCVVHKIMPNISEVKKNL